MLLKEVKQKVDMKWKVIAHEEREREGGGGGGILCLSLIVRDLLLGRSQIFDAIPMSYLCLILEDIYVILT